MNVNELIDKYETVIRINNLFINSRIGFDEKRIEKFELEIFLARGFIKELKQLENLEYNRKVKIPQFIKNTMDLYDGLPYMLADEYYNGSTEEVDSDVIQCWIDDNFELLCRAWLDGYEVEEEPKYYWRKKEKHNTHLDKRIYLVTGVDLQGSLGKGTQEKFTESEAKRLLKNDFDKFERQSVC